MEDFPMVINVPLRKAYVNNDNRTEVIPLSVVSGDIPIISHEIKEAVMNYDYALKNAFETEQESKKVQEVQQTNHLNYQYFDKNLKGHSSTHFPNPVQVSEAPIYSKEMRDLYNRYLE